MNDLRLRDGVEDEAVAEEPNMSIGAVAVADPNKDSVDDEAHHCRGRLSLRCCWCRGCKT